MRKLSEHMVIEPDTDLGCSVCGKPYKGIWLDTTTGKRYCQGCYFLGNDLWSKLDTGSDNREITTGG